jgi:hypothetical protein
VFYGSVGFTHRYQYAAPNGAFNPFSTRNSHILAKLTVLHFKQDFINFLSVHRT